MVVVRESIGANRPEDRLSPTGKAKAKLPDGREIEFELASWEFIGDTHIRFVFDGPQSMINATPQDLERLGIKTVEEALDLAIANIRKTYGAPMAKPFEGGVMQVQGKSPDLDSSYFLPLLNFEWVDSVVFGLAAGVKGGRSPAKRTLDAGCQPVRWLSWPMRHADASAMTSRSVSYA